MKLQTVTPYLRCHDAKAAMAFFEAAFDATVTLALEEPSGKIGHAELDLGHGMTLMLSDEYEDLGITGPRTLGGTSMSVNVQTDDVDALVARMVAAGATVQRPLEDQFYGHRSGALLDPFGNLWMVSQQLEDVPHDEVQRRWTAFFS